MKRRKKHITVRDLGADRCRETAEMIAELAKGAEPKWPVRFKSTGDKKPAGTRR